MADLFLIKGQLKLTLWLLGVAFIGGLLSTWHFLKQLDVGVDESTFFMSMVVTGAFGVAWIGVFIFFLMAKRVVEPGHYNPPERNFPWWTVKALLIVAVLVGGGIALKHYGKLVAGEFALLREGDLQTLQQRVSVDPAVLEKTEGKGGATLVQVAYREDRPQALAMLLENGASPEGLDAAGRNPVVASLGNPPMLKTLLDAGFEPDAPDGEGNPPLHFAVGLNDEGATQTLLDAGAKVDIRDALSRTPLMRAIEGDYIGMAETLLDHGADVNAFDRRGDTVLHRAVRKRNLESTRFLLGKGADPRQFNFTHMTPLHIAAQAGHDDLVSVFLETPGMAGLHDEADATPLDLALKAHKYDTAELLIGAGADINRVLANGDTQMHAFILARDYRTTRFLINQGGRVDIPNARGETALDVMRRKQLDGLVEMVDMRDNPDAYTNSVESAEMALP